MSLVEPGATLPTIWLRSFYGFSPEEDGFLGWTERANRDRLMALLSPGDLFLVYGADSSETPPHQKRQALGLLAVDLQPIMDVDKQSEAGRRRKLDNGWQNRWIYALPVRRAWRIENRIDIRHLAQTTYSPESGRAIAAWSKRLSEDDVERVKGVNVVEIPVFGEPPLADPPTKPQRFIEFFRPSRGLTPAFGTQERTTADGDHVLYLLRYNGDVASFLGRSLLDVRRKVVVKLGYSNEPDRRCAEVNGGIPPAAKHRWSIWLKSAPYHDGMSAKLAEDCLKATFDQRYESLGGEFFLADENRIQVDFGSAPGAAGFSLKASS